MEAEKKAPPTAPTARLKISGAWSGSLEVQLESWTLPMLRSEVAERSGGSPDCINLIYERKLLLDVEAAALSLLELGFKNNSKVLAITISPDSRKALNKEAATSQFLEWVWDVALEVAERLTAKVKCGSETDKRGIIMGLVIHAYAKMSIKRQEYKEALDVLSMAEDAFSLCDPKFTEMLANVLVLELDRVWCHFMLQNISFLSEAGIRLAKARQGFGHFKPVHADIRPVLAIYMRLELLEGVVAYLNGNLEESRKALSSAQAKYAHVKAKYAQFHLF